MVLIGVSVVFGIHICLPHEDPLRGPDNNVKEQTVVAGL
jgi:hypothetical protein